MKRPLSPLLSSALSSLAAILVLATVILAGQRFGPWQLPLLLGGLCALGSVFILMRRRIRAHVRRLLRRRRGPGESPRPHPPESDDLDLLPADVAQLLEERLQHVERRERDLADRLAAYQQWLEFPPPTDLSQGQPPISELLERDRRLARLLEQKTAEVFEKIRQNTYSPGGTLQAKLVRDDAYALAEEIARLYGRKPGQPWAGVSSERVLRAASRCCLRFLVELEKLPLDLRCYDLVSVYGYVRQTVKVYGMYQTAKPYMSWLTGAYYSTRFALGANPLVLGAWWFARSLGTRGATVLAWKIANRWALSFLHDIVRVIGYEMASIYDEGFRYRDPNWCYAAELTEVLHRFPRSENSLRQALSQIGALQLRNEYDRVFFFRCIIEGKSAGVDRVQVSDLPPEQRRQIADRLEAFLTAYVTGKTSRKTERWREEVQRRLDIPVAVGKPLPPRPAGEQEQAAIRALAGFLLEIKQSEPESLPSLLANSGLARELPAERQADLWRGLRDDPPFFFEIPELEPAGPVAKAFLAELASLAVRVAPRYPLADEVVISAAVHLRDDARRMKSSLDQAYVEEVSRRLPDDAPLRRLPPDAARAVLDLAPAEEKLEFVYSGVLPIASALEDSAEVLRARTWLVGVGDRLLAFTMKPDPQLIWEGGRQVSLDCRKGYVRGTCRISGGLWLSASTIASPAILVNGAVLRTTEQYFGPLLRFCREPTGNASEAGPE